MAKVLVIEDEAAVRHTLARILKVGGHEVEEAANGRDGVDALVHGRFDLVITDLLMPVEGGVHAIRRIRELDGDIPIIAISGADDEGPGSPLNNAMEMGANMRLGKPFLIDDVLAAVSVLLNPDTD